MGTPVVNIQYTMLIDMTVAAYSPLAATSVAVAKRTSNSASSNWNGVSLPWDNEQFDTDAYHDTSTNNSRITIPSSMDGRYVIVTASVYMPGGTIGDNVTYTILKNGSSSYDGVGIYTQNQFSTEVYNTVSTQPVLVAAGDYFEVQVSTTDITEVIDSTVSTFGIWVVA
jgi:hypothetical protein